MPRTAAKEPDVAVADIRGELLSLHHCQNVNLSSALELHLEHHPVKISAITPTADRPVGFSLCERFMARQTLQPDEWIVADGGQVAASCTMGQVHVHEPRPPGADNFAHNLLNGLARATGDVIVWIEDDDWYSPEHIATVVAALDRSGSMLSGDDVQQYYNIRLRVHRTFHNVGASLCQTAMRRGAVDLFRMIVQQCLARKSYGVDTTLWRAVPTAQWAITGKQTAIGIKGLPGLVGLGIGHRPDGKWKPDPELEQLRAWIGDDADIYAEYRRTH